MNSVDEELIRTQLSSSSCLGVADSAWLDVCVLPLEDIVVRCGVGTKMNSVDEELIRTQLSSSSCLDVADSAWLDVCVLSLEDIVVGCGVGTNKFARFGCGCPRDECCW